MSIYEKLLSIQTELKVPKSQYNKFGGYNYRNCEDILETLKPLLKQHNATVLLTDEIENIGDRFYVRVNATFIDIESGEKVTVSALAREDLSKKRNGLISGHRLNIIVCTEIRSERSFLY